MRLPGFAVQIMGIAALGFACAPPAPAIPAVDGPLELSVRYPTEVPLALRDSVSVWGSVGSGLATLRVNNRRVKVAPNGAFADWLPLPVGPAPVLEFVATLRGRTMARRLRLHRSSLNLPTDLDMRQGHGWGLLRRPSADTLDAATRVHPITARWLPDGPFAMLLPVGSRLPIEARTDQAIGLRVAPGLRVWVSATEVDSLSSERPDPIQLGPMHLEVRDWGIELSVPESDPLPSTVELHGTTIRWLIFGAKHSTSIVALPEEQQLVRGVTRVDGPPGRADVEVRLATRPAGWRARWADGRLTLDIRSPRGVRGLHGLVVALDPGHPPAGTTGPTGLREDSVTLEVARAAARGLATLGARAVVLRADAAPLSLPARLAAAEAANADVLVSIHLDAPAEYQAPRLVDNTGTYYQHPLARKLAVALEDAVAAAMAQRRRGAARAQFVILRSTWFPSVLVEGTCLVLPEREALFRSRAGVESYAHGVVVGLARWASGNP